jgi:hypothetical protein
MKFSNWFKTMALVTVFCFSILSFVGCTRTAGYTPDGNEIIEDDWTGTIILVLLLVALAAAASASSVHGSLDSTTIKVTTTDTPLEQGYKSWSIDHRNSGKPLEVKDLRGEAIGRFGLVADSVKSGDRIHIRIDKDVMTEVALSHLRNIQFSPSKDNLLVKVKVNSDFDLQSKKVASSKFEKFEFSRTECPSQYKANLILNDGKLIKVHAEVIQ